MRVACNRFGHTNSRRNSARLFRSNSVTLVLGRNRLGSFGGFQYYYFPSRIRSGFSVGFGHTISRSDSVSSVFFRTGNWFGQASIRYDSFSTAKHNNSAKLSLGQAPVRTFASEMVFVRRVMRPRRRMRHFLVRRAIISPLILLVSTDASPDLCCALRGRTPLSKLNGY